MLLQKLIFAVACVVVASNCLAVSEEEYLKNAGQYVDSEASKMDATQALDPDSAPASTTPLESKSKGQLNQAEFESYLKRRYGGTFPFYQSLSTEEKAMVYQEFSSGMPMRKIRRLVIKLTMQHRK